ncbi:MAG: hypothetical protein IKQ92_08060 [Clostridia bacterium]|nr:hypothetical protein [Clostridia bacterium]
MTGFQRIFVSEANGTIPIAGALVYITDYAEEGGGDVLYSLRTDEDGLTPTVGLPAPDEGESLRPGAARPYALYGIQVMADGYYPAEYVAVPVFPGVVSLQNVTLIPLGEADAMPGAFGRTALYETPDVEALQPGGLRREDIGNENGMLTGGTR